MKAAIRKETTLGSIEKFNKSKTQFYIPKAPFK